MRNSSFKKYLPGIAWFFLLAILLAIPGRDLPDTDDWMKKLQLDKFIHAGLFGMLAYLFMRPLQKAGEVTKNLHKLTLLIVILTSAWGLCTEFLQESLVKGRSFDYWDWVADTIGALLARLYFHKRLPKINASDRS